MLALCLDVGNTLVKIGVFDEDRLIFFRTTGVADYSAVVQEMDSYSFDAAILSSVSGISEQLMHNLKQAVQTFILLNHETPLPIANHYETRETLGNDRLAAVIGASFLHPAENLLVIDAGTAITFDFINMKSEFLGGNISPGIQMRFRALHSFTSKLPLIERNESYVLIGRNTRQAINSGVLQGIIAETDGTIDLFRSQYPDLKVIVTGGDAHFFDKKLKNTIFVVPNLVLIGLNRIIKYNTGNAKQ